MPRRHPLTVVFALCLVLVIAAVVGCSSSGTSSGRSGGSMMGPGGSSSSQGPGMMSGGVSGTNTYSSLGKRIFLTGVGTDNQEIQRSATRVSQSGRMMGGGGCASCHGATGRGGTIRMMTGTAIKTPDVTYDALIQFGFTDLTIPEAIRNGLDENGDPLNEAMPRWQMSDADLEATVAYLKELGGR